MAAHNFWLNNQQYWLSGSPWEWPFSLLDTVSVVNQGILIPLTKMSWAGVGKNIMISKAHLETEKTFRDTFHISFAACVHRRGQSYNCRDCQGVTEHVAETWTTSEAVKENEEKPTNLTTHLSYLVREIQLHLCNSSLAASLLQPLNKSTPKHIQVCAAKQFLLWFSYPITPVKDHSLQPWCQQSNEESLTIYYCSLRIIILLCFWITWNFQSMFPIQGSCPIENIYCVHFHRIKSCSHIHKQRE